MTPPKRRSQQGSVEHAGRITRTAKPGLPTAGPPVARKTGERRPEVESPSASSRYTPPKKGIRVRPEWHRRLGIAILVVGVLIVVLNDVPLFGGRSILPFGHSELYLILGVAVAGVSTRLFGWFDRAT